MGKNIVIIGGGEIGCETALYLKEQGKKVTVIEMLPTLSPETFHLTRDIMLWNMEDGITAHTGASCKEITKDSVRFTDKDGQEQTVPCDNVIISAGMRSRVALAESFRDCAPEFRAIGDCYLAKNVRTATQTAFDAVMNL